VRTPGTTGGDRPGRRERRCVSNVGGRRPWVASVASRAEHEHRPIRRPGSTVLEGLQVPPDALLVSLVLVLLLGALVRGLAAPSALLLGALVLLVVGGVLPPERAFVGFSSPATITIAALFVVAQAIRDHLGLERLLTDLLDVDGRGTRAVLLRLLPPVTLLSGLVNNTPIVATTAPIVRSWAERHGVATSRLLIPLSFATILGGTLTTIGTSTNLVVSGALEAAGREPLGFLTVGAVGAPMAVVGLALVVWLAPRLLPDRRSPYEQVAGNERDYALRLRVVPAGPLELRTVADARLRELPTTYLASIRRDGHEIAPVPPGTALRGDDELVFVGRVDRVRDLLDQPGLVEAEAAQTTLLHGDEHQLFECVVGASSSLAGSTLKAASFRGRYGAVVIAIHRAGERVAAKLGGVELWPGDTLLVLAEPGFADRWRGHRDLAVVAPIEPAPPPRGRDRYRTLTVVTTLGMVAFAATGTLPMVTSVLLAAAVLVGSGAIGFRRALDALDLDVLLIVAAAIGLGLAVEVSGLAGVVGRTISSTASGHGVLLGLGLLVVGTLVLTELITNVAAAALVVPIAIDVADRVGAEPRGFAVAVALAASASFLTPIGYQTNTIVYGLGGYRFGDYWRLGLPLAAAVVVTCLATVPLVWP
jgi:di/tricarboxylate transporter